MPRSIYILPQIKEINGLTKLEKEIASEITRFTTREKWFYKLPETFCKELSCTTSTLKKIYSKLKKHGWLNSEKCEEDRRKFKYEMTQEFFDYISNFNQKKDKVWAKLGNLLVTEKSPISNQIVTSHSVQSPVNPVPDKANESLIIEGINVLSNEGINKEINKENFSDKEIVDEDNLMKFLKVKTEELCDSPKLLSDFKKLRNKIIIRLSKLTEKVDFIGFTSFVEKKCNDQQYWQLKSYQQPEQRWIETNYTNWYNIFLAYQTKLEIQELRKEKIIETKVSDKLMQEKDLDFGS